MSPAVLLLLHGRTLSPAAYLLLARATARSAPPAPVEPAPATPIAASPSGAREGTYKGRKWRNSGEASLERFEKKHWNVK